MTAECPPTYYILAKAIAVAAVAANILAISEKVKAMAKQVTLHQQIVYAS